MPRRKIPIDLFDHLLRLLLRRLHVRLPPRTHQADRQQHLEHPAQPGARAVAQLRPVVGVVVVAGDVGQAGGLAALEDARGGAERAPGLLHEVEHELAEHGEGGVFVPVGVDDEGARVDLVPLEVAAGFCFTELGAALAIFCFPSENYMC